MPKKETHIGQGVINGVVKTDTTGLDNLLAVGDERWVVRVGILGNSAHAKSRREVGGLKKHGGHRIGQNESEESNADIGLKMEKGSKAERIPARSWLVTPLEDHLPEYFEKIGQYAIELIIVQQALKNYQQLGVICEQIIAKGFSTGGYGKWKPLSRMTIELKQSSAILIDTGQLSKSVQSTVVKA